MARLNRWPVAPVPGSGYADHLAALAEDPASAVQKVPGHGGGSLLTGDPAVMDDDGPRTVVDRLEELIVAGGFSLYPSEVGTGHVARRVLRAEVAS